MTSKILDLAARICCAVVGSSIIVGATASWFFGGALMVQWTMHATLLMVPVLVIWRRKARLAMMAMGLCALGAWPSLYAAWSQRAPTVADGHADSRSIAVATFNIHKDNPMLAGDLPAIRAIRADLVALIEIDRDDEGSIRSDARWPYQRWEHGAKPDAGWRGFGVALLSRFPLGRVQVDKTGDDSLIDAEVMVEGQILRVFLIHARSPMTPERWQLRSQQLAFIAHRIGSQTGPVLALGDYNCTPNDPAWRRFLAESGLMRPVGSAPATWPAFMGAAGIPIDHILTRNQVVAGAPRAVHIDHSDHQGLSAEIWLPRSEGRLTGSGAP